MGAEKEHISLENLGSGAATELFNLELQRVLENISDENTKPTAMREVTLKVKIKPGEDRDYGTVEISCAARLAPVKPYPTNIFIGRHLGRTVATEHNPKQAALFETPANVTDLSARGAQS
jgi:hypothetical protein